MVSSAVPSNASGTTTRLHQGIAIRFANGPASEACPNSIALNGSKPSVATPCADRNVRSHAPRVSLACRVGMHHTNQATPAKLSQKPAPRIASGSTSNTAIAASASASAARCTRRDSSATTTTAIISIVRTVGSAKPATAV